MSDDSSEQDHRGLAAWLNDSGIEFDVDSGVVDRDVAGRDVPEQRGSGPAYVVSFGWIPARLPPAPAPAWSIPSPRQAPDDLRR